MHGDVYFVQREADRSLVAVKQRPVQMAQLDGLNIAYGNIAELAAAGVNIARGHVPPGAVVPPHAGPSLYALYVLAGRGTLTLNASNDAETDRLAYKPGDLIVFPPDAKHGWINDGTDAFEWLGVDIAATTR